MKKLGTMLILAFTLLPIACSSNNELKAEQPPVSSTTIGAEQPIRIVCVGNSITAGFGSTSEATAWPGQANLLLGNRYAVINCAVSGTTMFKNSDSPYWATPRYTQAKNSNPQILVIGLGTNDADPWRWNSLKGQFKTDYLDMVREFRQGGKDPIIYMCLPPPLFGSAKAAQNTVVENELIPLIKEIAKEVGAYVIDYHQPLLGASPQFPDDVHPDDAGAALMAQIAYDHIKKNQVIEPHVTVEKGEVKNETVAIVEEGGNVTLTPKPENGTWTWTGPNSFSSSNRVVSLKNVKKGGTYTAVYTDGNGQRSILNFLVSIKGRKASSITAKLKNKDGAVKQTNTISTNPGTTITLSPETTGTDGTWSWTGPNGFFAGTQEILLETLVPARAGKYVVTYTDKDGSQSWLNYFVTVEGDLICPNTVSYININGSWQQTSVMEVKEGQSLTFGPHPSNGQWSWEGPAGFISNRREATVSNFNSQKAGDYIGTFTNAAGCKVELIVTLKLKP